jgi:hypothetical protein
MVLRRQTPEHDSDRAAFDGRSGEAITLERAV